MNSYFKLINGLNIYKLNNSINTKGHIHEQLEICQVIEGSQKIKIKDNEYILNTGDTAIIFPEYLHSYSTCDNIKSKILILKYEPEIYKQVCPNIHILKQKNYKISQNTAGDKSKMIFNQILTQTDNIILLSCSMILLSDLIESIDLVQTNKLGSLNLTCKILKYIETSFNNDITLKDISHKFGVNPHIITNIFSDKLNTSFNIYIGMLRSEHAAKLIRSTQLPLTVIGELSGFGSSRTFNRVFKKNFNITPKEYRTLHKKTSAM